MLEQGIGVSLINHVPEELLFVTLRGIRVEFITSSAHQCLNATIQHLQVDNKLANSHNPVMVYPSSPLSGEVECNYPILHVYAEKVPHKSPFAIVFKELNIKVRELTILLEERLLFKLLQWAGVGHSPQQGPTDRDEIRNMLTQRTVTPSTSDEVTRQIYFDQLRISETELRVSMHTTSQLPDDLTKIKQHLGFPLVKFESPITLEGFVQCHVLGTPGVYSDALVKHYKGVLKNQAIKIGLSVDFLGNPVGLLTDVASGVSGMLSAQPDVVGLVRDVAHGMSDTTSKLTGTVSHMFGQATFDSSFQEEREQLLESAQSSSEHFQAGLIGLTSGVFGGVTSLITQPYKGALEYGVGGFLAGVGKGIIGTVAKPVAGLFDFASGTTAALRETTSRVSRQHPPPVRHRRCCVGASGALVPYSMSQARGQEYLMRLNDGEPSEKLVSYELLYENSPKDRMKVIISSQYLYFFRESPPEPSSIDARFSLDDLAECRPAQAKSSVPTVYIVLSLVEKEGSTYKAPKYKCMDDNRSTKIAQLINYAKNLHEEEKHVVRTLRLQQGTIW